MPALPIEPIRVFPSQKAMLVAITHPALSRRARILSGLVEGLVVLLILGGVVLGTQYGHGWTIIGAALGLSIENENRHRAANRIANAAIGNDGLRNYLLLKGIAERIVPDADELGAIWRKGRRFHLAGPKGTDPT